MADAYKTFWQYIHTNIYVMLVLSYSKSNKILNKDSPNGANGFEIINFTLAFSDKYSLAIQRLEKETLDKGYVSFFLKKFTKQEVKL
jgi:hypothetical protein